MSDIVLGALALVAGASFCFRGYLAMRLLIPPWGALAGFSLGAGLVAAVAGEGFLAGATGWLVGLVLAVVFAAAAYLYYALSIVLIMGSTGFLVGSGAMLALDVSWNWLVVLVGIAVGVALAALAIIIDLPMIVLVLVTAVGGAAAMTAGLMLFAGALGTDDLTRADVVARVQDDWWWYLLYLGFAIVGIASQVRSAERLDQSMRHAWDGDPV
ncbi:MAG: DUF4203 domain-containing protein [Acidimicrobiales bacterium]